MFSSGIKNPDIYLPRFNIFSLSYIFGLKIKALFVF